MKVNYLNPFLEAAREVLAAEADVNVTHGALSLQRSALTTDEITVLVSLVGQVQGVVLYGLSEATALNLVGRIMAQQFTEFDNLAQSGIAELGNVITGRASVKLAEAGYVTDISPPSLVHGRDVTISTLDFPRVVVPLSSDAGIVTVHLALRETKGPGTAPLALGAAAVAR
jgi:chemotaxis protein CheX